MTSLNCIDKRKCSIAIFVLEADRWSGFASSWQASIERAVRQPSGDREGIDSKNLGARAVQQWASAWSAVQKGVSKVQC
jgi:hypothetical protein